MARKVEIQKQTFAAFGGDEENAALLLLREGVSTRDSKNIYLDKLGRLSRVLGYVAQGSAYTTDTGGDATLSAGLYDYSFASGGSVTRELIGVFDDGTDEYELAKSTDEGATWALLKDLGSGYAGKIADSAAFGNKRYFTFGNGAPQVYDGTSVSDVGVTRSPTPSAAEVAGETGNLSGGYEYRIVAMKAGKVRVGGSEASTEITVEDKKVTVTWTASGDGDVIGYEIYRTSGTGELFYRAAYVDGRTTESYEDNMVDTQLFQGRILLEIGDPPANGMHFCEQHQSRMWWARTSDAPRTVIPSAADRAEEVDEVGSFDCTGKDGGADFCTGMTGDVFRSLIVWLERSVWRISGTGTLINNVPDYRREQTPARVGTVSHRSAVEVPEGARFMSEGGGQLEAAGTMIAYFTPELDIRILGEDGQDTIISKSKRDFLDTVNYAARDTIHAVQHPVEPAIVWFVPTGESTVPNAAIVWNYAQGAWHEIDSAPFLSSVRLPDGDVLVGSNSVSTNPGLTYAWWSGNTFNGTAIDDEWWSKPVYGHDGEGNLGPTLKKRARKLDLVYASESSSRQVTVEWHEGYVVDGATAQGTATLDVEGASFSHVRRRVLLKDTNGDYASGRVFRFRLAGVETGAPDPWILDHFVFHFQALEGQAGDVS